MRIQSNCLVPHRACAGISLLETVVYVAMLALLLGFAYSAYYRTWGWSRTFDRNAQDILHSMRAGESWRQDIRRALEVTPVSDDPAGVLLDLRSAGGRVRYAMRDQALWRQGAPESPWIATVRRVESCRVLPGKRGELITWRLELKLLKTHRETPIRPQFTFLAAQGTHPTP